MSKRKLRPKEFRFKRPKPVIVGKPLTTIDESIIDDDVELPRAMPLSIKYDERMAYAALASALGIPLSKFFKAIGEPYKRFMLQLLHEAGSVSKDGTPIDDTSTWVSRYSIDRMDAEAREIFSRRLIDYQRRNRDVNFALVADLDKLNLEDTKHGYKYKKP